MLLTLFRLAMSKLYTPPAHVRGMKVLDRQAFSNDFIVPCIRVPKIDGPRHQKLFKLLKPFLLEFRGLKTVLNGDEVEGAQQEILVDDGILADKGTDLQSVISDFEDYCEIGQHHLQVNYENWSPRAIFKAVLPADKDAEHLGANSYSIVGHLIQLNLREGLNEYKHLIGQVLLDHISTCRTVINKREIIEGQFRNLNFELLAGEPDYMVLMQENGCRYKFDFSKVFWNTRLSREHERLVKTFKDQHVVYDVCAGVGPFAIPAAKRKLPVVANDLNPDCVEYLRENAKLNKVTLQGIHCLDGSRFITEVAGPDFIRRILETRSDKDDAPITTGAYFVMNLPAMAVEFLPAFVGLLRGLPQNEAEAQVHGETAKKKAKLDISDLPPVYVHCYTFIKGDDSYQMDDFKAAGVEKVKKMLTGWELHDISAHDVRNVAQYKEMLCVSFRADEKMLLADKS